MDGPLLIYVNRLRLRIAKGVNITVKFVSIAVSFGYVINIYITYHARMPKSNTQKNDFRSPEAKGPDSYHAEHRFLELIDVSRLNTYTESFKEMT